MTGECVAQVSSQTLRNLAVIDQVTQRLVLRPLIATDKEDIVRMAADIGTREFAANMPEYCGVISVNPTTRARLDRVEAQEQCSIWPSWTGRSPTGARPASTDWPRKNWSGRRGGAVGAPGRQHHHRYPSPGRRGVGTPASHVPVLKIPFYELHSRAAELDTGRPICSIAAKA